MKFTLTTLALALSFLSASHSSSASAELMINGTLDSMTYNDFVVLSNGRLYYLNKDKIDSDLRAMLEKNPRGTVNLRVPMQSIDDMKMARPVSAASVSVKH